jgi:hypothetical protein
MKRSIKVGLVLLAMSVGTAFVAPSLWRAGGDDGGPNGGKGIQSLTQDGGPNGGKGIQRLDQDGGPNGGKG